MDKNELRKKYLDIRNKQNIKAALEKSSLIYKKLISSYEYKNAATVLCYISFGSEVDTLNFIQMAILDNKNVCVPVCREGEIIPAKINSLSNLKKNIYGILEPCEINAVLYEKIDLNIVPAIVFDKKNHRIGYGKGYYDRLIKKLPKSCKNIGIAFDFQIVDEIPIDEFDQKLDDVLSD